jgi:hypothetical protein
LQVYRPAMPQQRLSAALIAHHDVAISAALNESLW